jgi:ABC-type transport system involved in multi-copper enzyme maturation permease subunit
MTASISTTRPAPVTSSPRFGAMTGFRPLLRKELREWRRARRAPIAFVASVLFLVLGAMNAWIISNLPADVTEGADPVILDPMVNLVGPVLTHVFVVISIFAIFALIAAERESGTLAWTASKPVSRSAIWLAKFASASVVMWIVVGLVPLLATVVAVSVLYGPVPVTMVLAIALGMAMVITIYVAVALTASTLVTSQAAVAGITFAVISLAPMIAAALPDPTLMPTSILDWAVQVGIGERADVIPVIGWALTTVALVVFSLRRMERLEL